MSSINLLQQFGYVTSGLVSFFMGVDYAQSVLSRLPIYLGIFILNSLRDKLGYLGWGQMIISFVIVASMFESNFYIQTRK